MAFILAAGDPLAPWGQIAAIIILLYMLISILLGLGLALGLMIGLRWVREKAELIKKLRPTVDSVNTTAEAAIKGVPAAGTSDNKIVRTVAEVPARAHSVEEKIEQGSDRVAGAVIEFRARTMMAKQVVKAFFLPGLTAPRQKTVLEKEGVGFRSPGYKMLVDEKVPGEAPVEYGTGYTGNVRVSEIKEEPVDVVATTPKELRDISTSAPRQDVPIR